MPNSETEGKWNSKGLATFASVVISMTAVIIAWRAPTESSKKTEYLKAVLEANEMIDDRIEYLCTEGIRSLSENIVEVSIEGNTGEMKRVIFPEKKGDKNVYNIELALKLFPIPEKNTLNDARSTLFKLHILDPTYKKDVTNAYLGAMGYSDKATTINSQMEQAFLFKQYVASSFNGRLSRDTSLYIGDINIEKIQSSNYVIDKDTGDGGVSGYELEINEGITCQYDYSKRSMYFIQNNNGKSTTIEVHFY